VLLLLIKVRYQDVESQQVVIITYFNKLINYNKMKIIIFSAGLVVYGIYYLDLFFFLSFEINKSF